MHQGRLEPWSPEHWCLKWRKAWPHWSQQEFCYSVGPEFHLLLVVHRVDLLWKCWGRIIISCCSYTALYKAVKDQDLEGNSDTEPELNMDIWRGILSLTAILPYSHISGYYLFWSDPQNKPRCEPFSSYLNLLYFDLFTLCFLITAQISISHASNSNWHKF